MLAVVLTIARATILKDMIDAAPLFAGMGILLQGSFADWATVALLAAFSILIVRPFDTYRSANVIAYIHIGLCLVLSLWGISNIAATRLLGEPVTKDWLIFSDIFNSTYMWETTRAMLSFGKVAIAIIGIAVFCIGTILFSIVINRSPYKVLFVSLLGLGFAGTASTVGGHIDHRKTANAAVAFVASVMREDTSASRLADAADEARLPKDIVGIADHVERPAVPEGQIRNVVFFVMESTAARFVDGFGGEYGVTPNLAGVRSSAISFQQAYAHVPATNYALVALNAAIVPELSANSMTEYRPDMRIDSIAEELKARGLRTGFFSSPDVRFQNTDGFARYAGYDTVMDGGDWPCAFGLYHYDQDPDSLLDTSNDLCTVPAVMAWINEQPDTPFFATIWTGMTHYPYYAGNDVRTYVEDDDLNKYLNALRIGDQAFGDLTAALESAGHLDDTLIVVLGDHGEAFGEHGTYSHGSAIYEENLHIPLLFVNRNLFSGQSSDIIAATSDIAPTVFDLMGIPAPASWQGASVFAQDRPDGTLFFAPWNGFQIGFRDGSRKFMTNAHTGATELYDLATDPNERNNLAPHEPEAVAAAQASLAAWIKTQDIRTRALLSADDAQVATDPAPTEMVIYASGTFNENPPIAEIRLDGQLIGSINVSGSVSNAEAAVDDAAIAAAVSAYSLPMPDVACPKQLSVTFANDAWAGDGQTGDTNLSIARIEIGETQYWPSQFTRLTDSEGGEWAGLYTFWTNGTAELTLALDPSCLVSGVSGGTPAVVQENPSTP